MNFRLWFPQLDVYDTIRRMGVVLHLWQGEPMSIERLSILDFYFANTPLLHHTNMPQEVRRKFNQLRIERPEKAFVSFPSAPILFTRMEPVQREALRTLTGKGLVDREVVQTGTVLPSSLGKDMFEKSLSELLTEDEQHVVDFLVSDFGQIDEQSIAAFRRRTGLRRIS